MRNTFLPNTDAGLQVWSANLSDKINAQPELYHVSVQTAQEYRALHEDFASAMQECNDPDTRTRGRVARKNNHRAAVKKRASQIVSQIKGAGDISIELLTGLSIKLRKKNNSRIPPPSSGPIVVIERVDRNVAYVRLIDADKPGGWGRPARATGAIVSTYTSELDPPTDIKQWHTHRNVGRTRLQLPFPSDLTPGAKVWIVACWFSNRKECSPFSVVVNTRIPGGGAGPMKQLLAA